jgi:tetratricopeptide (TPR) repeat protein
MNQHRTVGRCIVVGLGVIALACACYLVLGNKLDAIWYTIWGPYPLLGKAEKCLERGDFDGALRFANRAVQCRPDMEVTYDVRAHVFEARGEFRESIQDYTKVVSFRDYFALADRGRVYEKMGEFDKAAADYCEVLRSGRTKSGGSSNVRLVAFHRVMGPGEHGIERYPDAVPSLLKFINEAIKREPDDRGLRECRELILRSEGGNEEK